MTTLLAGVDTGGTFTDIVLLRDGKLQVHKVLSTPDDPSRAILDGLAQVDAMEALRVLVHGSTVATNAVLERKAHCTHRHSWSHSSSRSHLERAALLSRSRQVSLLTLHEITH